MPDSLPILAFKVAAAQFDLATGQAFISIRDQAVRVRTLLHAMDSAGLFRRPFGNNVLVVGAGYAGVSAALWLADHGVQTTLVDAASRPFDLQHRCTTRYLSLTQYDWPARHFGQHDYPGGLHPSYVEYDWLAKAHKHLSTSGFDKASNLASGWEMEFVMHSASLPNLIWRPNTRVVPNGVATVPGGVRVDLEDTFTKSVTPGVRFDYVFLAVGFGTDGAEVATRTPNVTQKTPAFWDSDTLASASPPRKILISGGGDGALQDFLRAIVDPTFQTAERILDRIELGMRHSSMDPGDVERAWSLLREAVAYAETQSGRAATWVGETHSDVWNELARHYRWAIERYLAPHARDLFHAITMVVDRLGGPAEVVLAFPDLEPGKVYGLNRFLFMLLAEFAEYMTNPGHGFLGDSPPTPWGLNFPTVRILRRHRTELTSTVYDSATRSYEVALTQLDPPFPVMISDVDELLIRHGTRKAPPLTVRVGRLPLRLELGRIQLPFAAVF